MSEDQTPDAENRTDEPQDLEIVDEGADDQPDLTTDDIDKYFGQDVDDGDTDDPADESEEEGDEPEGDEPDDDESGDEPQDSAFDLALIERAARFGYGPDDLKGFGSAETLTKTLDMMEQMAGGESTGDEEPPADGADGQDQGQADAQTQQQQGDSQPAEVSKFEISLPEDMDPDLKGQLDGLNDHYFGVAQQQAKELQAARQEVANMRADAFAGWFDGKVQQLDGLDDVLGKESMYDLDPNSEQAKNRLQLMNQYQAIQEGRQRTGQKPLAPAKVFEQAVASVFGSQLKQQARKEVGSKLKAHSKSILNRPSGRKGSSDVPPKDAAVDAVGELLGQFGGDDQGEEF